MQDELEVKIIRVNETAKRLDKAYENYFKSVETVNAELKDLRAYKLEIQKRIDYIDSHVVGIQDAYVDYKAWEDFKKFCKSSDDND